MEIIGLTGKIGSGKDYVGSLLKERKKNSMLVAFADLLKIMVHARYNISYSDLYHKKTQESRLKLQEVGMEMREKYGSYFFAKALEMSMIVNYRKNHITTFIITDVRFQEEVKMIEELGGVIYRIYAPNRSIDTIKKEARGREDIIKKIMEHRSEIDLDKKEYRVIKNDYHDDIHEEIKKVKYFI